MRVDEQHDPIGEDRRQLRETRIAIGGGHVRRARCRRQTSRAGATATSDRSRRRATNEPSADRVSVTRVRSASCAKSGRAEEQQRDQKTNHVGYHTARMNAALRAPAARARASAAPRKSTSSASPAACASRAPTGCWWPPPIPMPSVANQAQGEGHPGDAAGGEEHVPADRDERVQPSADEGSHRGDSRPVHQGQGQPHQRDLGGRGGRLVRAGSAQIG